MLIGADADENAMIGVKIYGLTVIVGFVLGIVLVRPVRKLTYRFGRDWSAVRAMVTGAICSFGFCLLLGWGLSSLLPTPHEVVQGVEAAPRSLTHFWFISAILAIFVVPSLASACREGARG